MSAHEFRVTWRRDGQRKKARHFQSEPAAVRHALVLQGRIAEAYPDLAPDDFACCSGAECGCRGITNAEAWAQQHGRFPPLIHGPFVHRRDVGPWMDYGEPSNPPQHEGATA